MRILIGLVAAVTLAGCGPPEPAATSRHVGQYTFAIQCEERADCYQEAGRICRFGFTVLDSSSTNHVDAVRLGRNVYLTEDETSDVLVKCNERRAGQ